jgi:hypothetical protein
MGFAVSWLAIKGKAPETIQGELHLHATGRRIEIPEPPFVGSSSADGWYLILAQGAEHRLISSSVMEQLSRGCEAVTCTVEEHVMFSEASGWRDGQILWSVTHTGEDGPKDGAASGSLPPSYSSIRDRLAAQQHAAGGADGEVDYLFEIPVELARSLTGYRHDQGSPVFEAQGFEVLTSSAGSMSAGPTTANSPRSCSRSG